MNKKRVNKSAFAAIIAGISAAVIYLIVALVTASNVSGGSVVLAGETGLVTAVIVFVMSYIISTFISRARESSQQPQM